MGRRNLPNLPTLRTSQTSQTSETSKTSKTSKTLNGFRSTTIIRLEGREPDGEFDGDHCRTEARSRGLRGQPAQGRLARRGEDRDLAGRQLRGGLGTGDRRRRCD